MVERFSSEAIAIFSGQNKVTGFKIQRGQSDSKSYKINGFDEGSIVAVQEYSASEAIVAIVHGAKTSTVVLYSLVTAKVIKQEKFDFPIDNLVKLADSWVGICTTDEEGNSTLKVQGCFGNEKNLMVETELHRWIRYWNDFIPILTLSHEADHEKNSQVHLEIVKCAPKRSVYIKLLEELGVKEKFGDEIVKAAINNLW